MLDTVRLGVGVPGVNVPMLRKRGWTYHEVASPERSNVWATLATGDGVRLSYLAGIVWLSAEVSLPKLLYGDNSELLTSWGECGAGLERVRGAAEEAVGVGLAPLPEWRLSRVDPVWAWPVDPGLYVPALRWSRLPRTEPKNYSSSVSWESMRSGSVRARAYDKSAEAGREVARPFRLERQARPRREVVRVAGERVPGTVGELRAGHVFGMVAETMKAVGLDAPIPGPMEAKRRLIDYHGRRRGINLWRVLLEVQACGGMMPSDVKPRTRRGWEAGLRAAGIKSLSWQGHLPGLDVPGEQLPE